MPLFKRKQPVEDQARTPAAAGAVAAASSGALSGTGATRVAEPPAAPSAPASTTQPEAAAAATTSTSDEQGKAASTDTGKASSNEAGRAAASKEIPKEKTASTSAAASGKDRKAAAKDDRSAGAKMLEGANAVRSRIASLVWLLTVVCAVILAVAALMVALRANNANAIVSFVKSTAHTLDLGVLSPNKGIFTPKHDPRLVKAALINWGIAAVLYLVVGKILDRLIRP